MSRLTEYEQKRDFSKTAEPRGEARRGSGNLFVVQRHAATRLHYDFRLELDGTLLSWAVPKGPSFDPKEKRLAVRVEDHPVGYASFEGVIPEGEYGGGTVMVWDKGTWEPIEDPREGLQSGSLKFRLNGERLKGAWALIKMRGGRMPGDNWLLIKEKDEYARTGEAEVTAQFHTSALSGRDMQQIGGKATSKSPPLKARKGSARTPTKRPASAKTPDAEVAGVRLTHPDRLLFTVPAISKQQLAEYYESVAERILPHVIGRPLTLIRCPEGSRAACFVQRHYAEGMPKSVRRVEADLENGPAALIAIDDLQGLISLVQIGAIELHPWGSKIDDLEHPDRVVFDLDPAPGVAWKDVISAALSIRELLKAAGLESFVKTAGGKGLHIVAPIAPKVSWEKAYEFTQLLAEDMARREPKRFVTHMSKAKRRGKIFIDFGRNSRAATTVAAYCVRARPSAPVSMPLSWEDLPNLSDPVAFTISNAANFIGPEVEDPWSSFFGLEQSIEAGQPASLQRGR